MMQESRIKNQELGRPQRGLSRGVTLGLIPDSYGLIPTKEVA